MGVQGLSFDQRQPHASARPIAIGALHQLDRSEDDVLTCVAEEFGRLLSADGLMIEHRAHGGDLAVILRSGDCRNTDFRVHAQGSDPGDPAIPADRTTRSRAEPATLSATVPVADGQLTITTFFRSLTRKARQRSADLLTRVLPMLDPILKLWNLRRTLLQRTRALTAAVDQTSVGLVLIDASGLITFANKQAQRLLSEGDGIARSGDRLRAGSLKDTMRLQSVIEQAITIAGGPSGSSAAEVPVVALKRQSRRPLMASAIGIAQPGRHNADSVVVVHLIDPEEDLAPLLTPVCQMYGLSPVESRMTCLLADGKTLAGAAEALGIRELTARGYLKQVFLKTATSRQAELMLLMLKSAVRSAPELGGACRVTSPLK